MLPASNSGSGENVGFPDTCNTPVGATTVPIPYVNTGEHAQATATSTVVSIMGMPALNLGSSISTTSGDEAGTAHWTTKGAGAFTSGNSVVSIEGLPAITLTSPTTGNKANDGAGIVAAPGATTILFTFAGAPEALDARLGEVDIACCMLDGDVGLLRIAAFGSGLRARVDRAIAELTSQGMRTLAIDVRGCPGGELEAFLDLASAFLAEGALLATVVDGEGDSVEHRSRTRNPHRVPLIILVDRRTASAAELFAGCLRAHGRATLSQEHMYGKTTAHAFVRGEYVAVARVVLPCIGEAEIPA